MKNNGGINGNKFKPNKRGAKRAIWNEVNSGRLQYYMEILVDPKIIEQLDDENSSMWAETEEEKEIKEKKEEYNKLILEQIAKVKFTEKQALVMKHVYEDGLTYKKIAENMGVSIHTIQEIREQAIRKIRKNIKYHFVLEN